MSIEEFLTAEYTFEGSTIVLIALIAGGVVLALSVYIINLRSKVALKENRSYGFLGKPLYQVAAFAFILGGVVLSVYTVTSPQTGISNTQAAQDIDVEFTYQILQQGTNYQIEFDIIPLLNKTRWGNDVTEKFDIFVNIQGSVQYNQFFYDRTSDTGATFVKIIAPDNYSVVITIVTDDDTKQFTRPLNLE